MRTALAKVSEKDKLDWTCAHCGGPAPTVCDVKQSYCSYTCSSAARRLSVLNNILEGKIPGWKGKTAQLKNALRDHLLSTRGTACVKCGWDGKHPVDGRSLTEINHIDGDAKNCSLDNLEILCPNCHSMTHNFRARNKNSSRLR